MPRPLSMTESAPSASSATSMKLASRDGFIHRIVDHLGEEVMHRLFIGAADIHAWAAAHRLQPFEHLDVGGG